MPAGVWGLEWLNENSQRSYPLTSDATKTDISGAVVIPDDFLIGLYFPIQSRTNSLSTKFFVHKLSISSIGLSLTIAYDNGTPTPDIVAEAKISRASHREYNSYSLPGRGVYTGCNGRIAIGTLDSVALLPEGVFTFDYAGGKLEVDAIHPTPVDVSGIRIVNGQDISSILGGVIEFVAGNNIRLTVVSQSASGATVRIDAIEGAGLSSSCVCNDVGDIPCIRTINGIAASVGGDFTITGDDCFSITSTDTGLQFTDTCSKPCCGCPETAALNQELQKLSQAESTVNGFLYALQGQVGSMQANILGSKLHDEGCNTCPESDDSV